MYGKELQIKWMVEAQMIKVKDREITQDCEREDGRTNRAAVL